MTTWFNNKQSTNTTESNNRKLLNGWRVSIVCGFIYSFVWFAFLNIFNPAGNRWDVPHLMSAFATTGISLCCLFISNKWILHYFRSTKLAIQHLLMLLISIPLFSVYYLFYWVIVLRQMIYGLATDSRAYPFQLFIIVTSLHLVMAVITISSLYNERVNRMELELEKVQRMAAETKLTNLQNQVDPHFLFNSLNILSALIQTDADRALSFTQKLAEVYRYFLKTKKEVFVSLREEAAFTQDYFYLISCRFTNCFILTGNAVPWNGSSDYYLIPGTLQLLIENVIKHNVANPNNPLGINIRVENDCLTVINRVVKKPTPFSGYGLRNLQERYAMLNKQQFKFGETDGLFYVSVPLIKNIKG